jgi:hypothetical protein
MIPRGEEGMSVLLGMDIPSVKRELPVNPVQAVIDSAGT